MSPVSSANFDNISIHALRVEGDRSPPTCRPFNDKFLSTPSGWRATLLRNISDGTVPISIHALRVEGDRDPVP